MSDLPPNLLQYLNRKGYNTFDQEDTARAYKRKPFSYQEYVEEILEGEELELLDINSASTSIPLSTPVAAPAAVPAGVVTSSIAPAAAVIAGTTIAAVGGAIYNTLSSSDTDNHKSPTITLPGHKYLGPGNTLNTGAVPIDDDDKDAFNHDHDYSKAKTTDEVREADREHILTTVDKALKGDIHSAISAIGISGKYLGESVSGVQYPIISGESLKSQFQYG